MSLIHLAQICYEETTPVSPHVFPRQGEAWVVPGSPRCAKCQLSKVSTPIIMLSLQRIDARRIK